MGDLVARFERLWAELAPIGRREDGGYDRFAWSEADAELRTWFERAATERGLALEQDRNANLWAWWGHDPAEGLPPRSALACGSHLDSVPGGGGYDGALGVLSGFMAVDELRSLWQDPPKPIAVAAFCEEEGARFGFACLGSRLSAGELDPAIARERRDAAGVRLADAVRAAGVDPMLLGEDRTRLSSLGAFVELHVEQGRFLAQRDAPLGIATEIWPHGRWGLRFRGAADHAGTAALRDRRDPVVPFAETVVAARRAARTHGGLATVGRALLHPNAANAVAADVEAWLDARAPREEALEAIVARVMAEARILAAREGVALVESEESRTAAVSFDPALRARVQRALGGGLPEMPTGAGHDAGILAAKVPTAMLFVRNPTGVSHSPAEHADAVDCVEGIRALARVLEELSG